MPSYPDMAAFAVRQRTGFALLSTRAAAACVKTLGQAAIFIQAAGKGGGGLCHCHISNDMPGIKGEYNLIKCLLTDSLANREAA